MKAIILNQPQDFQYIDREDITQPPAGFALVKVHRIGICGTDLHAYQGKQNFFIYPRVLGHELGVGIISVEKNEFGLQAGDRCSVEPYLNCGKCIACRMGKPNCCTDMRVLGVHIDGGMADTLCVPIHKLHKSATLSYDQLALVETLGIGCHAVNRAKVNNEDSVFIIGAGPIGLTVLVFAQVFGAKITMMDISDSRLNFCRDKMGVTNRINAKEDVLEQLLEINHGELPTCVIDCTGNPKSMESTFNYICHGGRIVFVGHYPGDLTFADPNFHKRETTLMGSRNAMAADFKQIISILEAGKINLQPWITHRAYREEMIEKFAEWLNPDSGVVKAVVDWTQ